MLPPPDWLPRGPAIALQNTTMNVCTRYAKLSAGGEFTRNKNLLHIETVQHAHGHAANEAEIGYQRCVERLCIDCVEANAGFRSAASADLGQFWL